MHRMKKRQKVLDLKPTQFAVGMLEVDEKIEVVRNYGKKELQAFIDENPIPVVLSPEGDLYMIDHHHFLSVCYHVGVKKVRIEVVQDLSRSKMGYRPFWKWMRKSGHVYPFCQFGEGPRDPLYLPRDIRGLADDPYRSLAWYVRKAGAFKNSERNYAEFRWANFFRARRLLDKGGPRGMPQVLIRAVEIAQSPAASRLPGFGKLNFGEKVKVNRTLKKKGAKIAQK